MRSLLTLILLVSGSGALCHLNAQCQTLTPTDVSCDNIGPGSCHQTVAINEAIDTEVGQNPGHFFFVSCCDQQIRSEQQGTFCQNDEVKRPEVADLASREPILVADCQGQYLAFGQGIDHSNDGWSASEASNRMASKTPLSLY
jgi:hypothetical protein